MPIRTIFFEIRIRFYVQIADLCLIGNVLVISPNGNLAAFLVQNILYGSVRLYMGGLSRTRLLVSAINKVKVKILSELRFIESGII